MPPGFFFRITSTLLQTFASIQMLSSPPGLRSCFEINPINTFPGKVFCHLLEETLDIILPFHFFGSLLLFYSSSSKD